jgi:hypothetical protein
MFEKKLKLSSTQFSVVERAPLIIDEFTSLSGKFRV